MSTQTRSGGGGGRNKSKAKMQENKENLAKDEGGQQQQHHQSSQKHHHQSKGNSGQGGVVTTSNNVPGGNDGSTSVTAGANAIAISGGGKGDHHQQQQQKQKGNNSANGFANKGAAENASAPKSGDGIASKEKHPQQQKELSGGGVVSLIASAGSATNSGEKFVASSVTSSVAAAGGAVVTHTTVKAKQPTAEQIRIAQITDIKSGMDDPKIQEKIQSLMETTQRSEEEVCCALQECDSDLDRAVIFLLETLPVGAFATTSKKKKKSQASAQKDGDEAAEWDTVVGGVQGSGGMGISGSGGVQLGGINVDLKEQQRRGGANHQRNVPGNQRSGGGGRGGRTGGYRDNGGVGDRNRDRNLYDKGVDGGYHRGRVGGDGGRMRGRDGAGPGGRGNYGARGGRGGGSRIGTRGMSSRDQHRGSRMNNDHQEIDAWDPVATSASSGTNANDLKPEESSAFTDTWGDWDNEEYTGSLSDTKVFTASTQATPSTQAPTGTQQLSSPQQPPNQTGILNSSELTAPPGLEQQVLNPPSSQIGKEAELMVQQYSTTVVSSTATAAVAAASGSAVGVSTASGVPQYSDMCQSLVEGAMPAPPVNASSSLSAEQSQYFNTLSSQNSNLQPSFAQQQPGSSVSQQTVQQQQATQQQQQSAPSNAVQYNAASAPANLTGQQPPPLRRQQRARVPPPSKIPSSAVEMPGDSLNTIGYLDVQFGALDFGADDSFDVGEKFNTTAGSTSGLDQATSSVGHGPQAVQQTQPLVVPSQSPQSVQTAGNQVLPVGGSQVPNQQQPQLQPAAVVVVQQGQSVQTVQQQISQTQPPGGQSEANDYQPSKAGPVAVSGPGGVVIVSGGGAMQQKSNAHSGGLVAASQILPSGQSVAVESGLSSSQNDSLTSSYTQRSNATSGVSVPIASMSTAAAALDQLTKSDHYGQATATNVAASAANSGSYQNTPYSAGGHGNKTSSYPSSVAPQGYNNISYSSNQVTNNTYPTSTNNYGSYNQGNVNAYQPAGSSVVSGNVVPNSANTSNAASQPNPSLSVNNSTNSTNSSGYLSNQYPVSQTSSGFPSQQSYQNSSQNMYGNAGLNSNTGYTGGSTNNASGQYGSNFSGSKLKDTPVVSTPFESVASTVSNSTTNNSSNNNVTSSSSLSNSSVVSTTTKSSSGSSSTGVVPNIPMVSPYIQTGMPFYQQAAVYSYEDLQLMQQRMSHVPGFYDINYQTPTSLGAAGVRDANLGSVAYSTMSDGRFTRTDNNSSPVSNVPSTLSQQTGSGGPMLNLPYAYFYGGNMMPASGFQYGTPAIYPQQMATNAATSGGQFQKPTYNSGYGSATAYDTLGQSGQDYSKNAYPASIVGQQQSKGQSVTNPQSGTGSNSDMAPSMYGKNHVALNKVNYDKQSFHSGTPPPYNLAGTQTAGATSGQPYGQHLYIPTMTTHHNINMHQTMHQDSNSTGQRPQNNNQGKTANKQGYSPSTYWTG
ncbi:protein lingerer isoform X1 [Anopheles bellator]|uniref:protein lingerer isoform X1 n=1 Tax=Anopheles bellator TaxID=139047 RepID=UPI002649EFCA|nr:protein lingerer isoform X1 [Anopheles bellator]